MILRLINLLPEEYQPYAIFGLALCGLTLAGLTVYYLKDNSKLLKDTLDKLEQREELKKLIEKKLEQNKADKLKCSNFFKEAENKTNFNPNSEESKSKKLKKD